MGYVIGSGSNVGKGIDAFNPAGISDVDAQTYIDAMSVTPSGARQTIIIQFFLDIKGLGDFGTDNIFSKMDLAYLLAADAEQAALLDIKRGFDATAINSPTFTVDRGFTAASTRYVQTNWVPSTDASNFTLNDACMGSYERTNEAAGSSYMFGAQNTSTPFDFTIWIPRNASDQIRPGIHNATNALILDNSTESRGLWVVRRTGATALQVFKNGSSFATGTDTSGSLNSIEIYMLADNQGGTAVMAGTRQISFFFAASSLSTTEQTNLFNSVETYMDAIGAGVVA